MQQIKGYLILFKKHILKLCLVNDGLIQVMKKLQYKYKNITY